MKTPGVPDFVEIENRKVNAPKMKFYVKIAAVNALKVIEERSVKFFNLLQHC